MNGVLPALRGNPRHRLNLAAPSRRARPCGLSCCIACRGVYKLREARRRRLSAASRSSFDRRGYKGLHESSKSLPIVFGEDGKPTLRRIDTLGEQIDVD